MRMSLEIVGALRTNGTIRLTASRRLAPVYAYTYTIFSAPTRLPKQRIAIRSMHAVSHVNAAPDRIGQTEYLCECVPTALVAIRCFPPGCTCQCVPCGMRTNRSAAFNRMSTAVASASRHRICYCPLERLCTNRLLAEVIATLRAFVSAL